MQPTVRMAYPFRVAASGVVSATVRRVACLIAAVTLMACGGSENEPAAQGARFLLADARGISEVRLGEIPRPLTPAPGSSSTGGLKSYASSLHPFAQDVWVVNSDGGGLLRLAEIAENMPSLTWSGDGATIYVLGPVATWRIAVASGAAEEIGPGIALAQIVWIGG
jgi:hypothetical protein